MRRSVRGATGGTMDGDDIRGVREARSMPEEDVVARIASLNVSGERRASDDASDERATAAGDETKDGGPGGETRADTGAEAPRKEVELFDGPGVPYAHKFTSVRTKGYGGTATLDGTVAADMICWDHFFSRPCVPMDGTNPKVPGSIPDADKNPCGLCHDFNDPDRTCSGRIREALGQIKPGKSVKRGQSQCRYGNRCEWNHPSDEQVRATLLNWYKSNVARSETPVWSVTEESASRFRAFHDEGRAAATSGDKSEKKDATKNSNQGTSMPTREREETEETPEVRARVTGWIKTRFLKKSTESPYLERFLNEPFFEDVMSVPRLRRLFVHKKSYKEVTEAFGTYQRIRELLPKLRVPGSNPGRADAPGTRLVIFDACSGRGIGAMLLSFWFPNAKIVMMDANGAMDLSHVQSLPNRNVVFRHVDLYGASVVETIKKETGGPHAGSVVVLVGTHLCGALSPRLIDLCFGMDEVHGMILCPCCMKGQLGGDCQRAGRARGVDPYVVLCETFARLCERECESAAAVTGRNESSMESIGDDNVLKGELIESSAPVGSVSVAADLGVCSPVNCFITVAKDAGGLCGVC